MKAKLLSVVMVLCLLLLLASSQFCKASGEGLNDDQMFLNSEQIYFTNEKNQEALLIMYSSFRMKKFGFIF